MPEQSEGPERKPVARTGMVGALLCVIAATLTMIGAFQDLVVAENIGGPQDETYIVTLWEFRLEADGVVQPAFVLADVGIPRYGVPLLFGIAMLFAAALLGMLTLARPVTRWFGLTTVVAATFLAAVVSMIVPQAMRWQEMFQPPPDLDQQGIESTVGLGPAYWTLIAGAVLAIAAAVVAWRQPRVEPERVEPETPPMGIPVGVHRLPDEPQDQP